MPMTPIKRKSALLEAGVTLTSIAQQLDLTLTQVSQVVAGRRRSKRVEEAVAAALGKRVRDVFPPRGPATQPAA